MLAAKEKQTAAGGSLEDCSTRARGVWLKAKQQVQLWATRSIALSMSKVKRYCLVTSLSWWLEGWLNLMCKAVNRLSRTWRGITMHSCKGAKGLSRLTTNKPFLVIVTTFKYLYIFKLVSFFDGLVPWARWAYVWQRSLHSDCIANQDARLVNGSLTLPMFMSWIEACRTTDSSV